MLKNDEVIVTDNKIPHGGWLCVMEATWDKCDTFSWWAYFAQEEVLLRFPFVMVRVKYHLISARKHTVRTIIPLGDGLKSWFGEMDVVLIWYGVIVSTIKNQDISEQHTCAWSWRRNLNEEILNIGFSLCQWLDIIHVHHCLFKDDKIVSRYMFSFFNWVCGGSASSVRI